MNSTFSRLDAEDRKLPETPFSSLYMQERASSAVDIKVSRQSYLLFAWFLLCD
jgi:hypothetical protein